MKKRIFALAIVLALCAGALASGPAVETFGAALAGAGKADLALGLEVVFGSGQKTNALRLTAFESSATNALPYPAKFILSYENKNMLFYPGFGFILTDLDVFLQRDAVKENFVLGGTIDAFASLLTTSVQMRLMRYPTDYVSEGFYSANTVHSRVSPLDEPMLILVDATEGFTAYLSVLYKQYPDRAFRVTYLRNFATNELNSLSINWLKPDVGDGSLSVGLGIENGTRGFLPEGAYLFTGYSAPIGSNWAFEGTLNFGSLQYGDVFRVDPNLAGYVKFIFDDGVSELVAAGGLETHQKYPQDKAPTFKLRLQYKSHGRFPIGVYLVKADADNYGVGLSYQF